MKSRLIVVAIATLGVIAADPALAEHKARHHYRSYRASACAPRPLEFSWTGWLFNGKPRPNGCAPAVYEYGEYIGQDPDPYIRLQLRRDPATGYTSSEFFQ